MDPMIVNTRAYRRVEEYRRTLAHKGSISNIQPLQNEQIEEEGKNVSSEEATQPDEYSAAAWMLPDRPQHKRPLYQATVVSDPGINHQVQYASLTNHNARSIPVTTRSPGLFVGEKARAMHKKASRLLFQRGSKESNATSSDCIGAAETRLDGRRGRRGFEDNFQQSIDFSQPDSLTAPPLVRAAQAGSIVEVEQLLDRGADLEACHVSSGRCALAVAAHCGNDNVVSLLLSQGARTDQRDASRSTPLHLAASRGHTGALKLLIGYGAVIEEKDVEGRTPLWLASSTGQLEVVEILLSKRAKVNARADAQLTALHVAAQRGDAAMIELLLRHGAHIDAKDGHFMSALHYACESGHESAVNVLLGRSADIEAPGKDFKTPLICAAARGQVHVIEILLKRKANLKSQADGKMNALHWACRNGHESAVGFLLAKRSPINAVNSDGQSALHLAVISKKFDVVELLLRSKADREVRCQRSYTALHYACSVGTLDIVKILLGYGAQVESTTYENGRPLHIAVTRGACDIVEELLAKGANHNSRDNLEDRALCIACSQGNLAIVETLLNAGTPLRSKFSDKIKSREDNPLCVAARHGHLDICSLLISRGASVRQKDELLWQPLRYAAYYGHPEVVRLLLSHGAEVSSTGASGGWGFDVTASRIGFAKNVDIPQERKTLVTSLLRSAEDREVLEREREADAQAVPLSYNQGASGPSELMVPSRPSELTAPSRAPPPPPVVDQNPRQQAGPVTLSDSNGTLRSPSFASSFEEPFEDLHNEASQQTDSAQRNLDIYTNPIYELDSTEPQEHSSITMRDRERILLKNSNMEEVTKYLKDNDLQYNTNLGWTAGQPFIGGTSSPPE